MKKLVLLSVCILIFFAYSAAGFAYSDGKLPSMQLLVSFAVISYADNKSMNNSTKNRAQEDADLGNSIIVPSSPYDKFRLNNKKADDDTIGFGMDFRYFHDNIGIGFQTGYSVARADSEMSNPYRSGSSDRSVTACKLYVVPIVATLFYRIGLESSKSFVLFGGGLGYYYGRIKFDYEDQTSFYPDDRSFRWYGEQSKIGYHILIEYDYVFENDLVIFGGIKGRYVKFDEFKDGNQIRLEYGTNKKLKAGLTGAVVYFGFGVSS